MLPAEQEAFASVDRKAPSTLSKCRPLTPVPRRAAMLVFRLRSPSASAQVLRTTLFAGAWLATASASPSLPLYGRCPPHLLRVSQELAGAQSLCGLMHGDSPLPSATISIAEDTTVGA